MLPLEYPVTLSPRLTESACRPVNFFCRLIERSRALRHAPPTMTAVINFLSVDAQLPLVEGGEVNFKSSDGFKKAAATLVPTFDAAVTSYEIVCPKGTTHVSIGATSFAAAVVINGTPGNMSSVDIRHGSGAAAIVISLEKPAGMVVNQYTLVAKISDADADATQVLFEKAPVPATDAAPHAHSHGGVVCIADHSQEETHGHGHGEKKQENHGHSHDGGKTACTEDHGHGHAHGEKKEEAHGHGDGEKKEENHGHSHDGGKTACTEDHGHGHGEKKQEKHGHGHGH